jgi:predicted nucleotidyltransferase
MPPPVIGVSQTQLAEFCQRWKVRELALFGSVLREDFRSDSDLDLLVTFTDEADWGLFDHLMMQAELQSLVGRKGDLISRRAVERSENWLRRNEILSSARVLFRAQEAAHVA